VRRFEDLVTYQLADEVRARVRTIVRRDGFRFDLRLRDQLSRAAESACPNLAEGFARFHPRDNARFVRVARASLTELVVHLDVALAARLIDTAEHDDLCRLARRAAGAATRYIVYLENASAPGTEPRRR
jgi:four helix bundle protein